MFASLSSRRHLSFCCFHRRPSESEVRVFARHQQVGNEGHHARENCQSKEYCEEQPECCDPANTFLLLDYGSWLLRQSWIISIIVILWNKWENLDDFLIKIKFTNLRYLPPRFHCSYCFHVHRIGNWLGRSSRSHPAVALAACPIVHTF